jgi:hypothetical protein
MALRSARSAGHAFMRPQSHIVTISLLSGKDWSKLISLQGTNAHGIIVKLDREQANLLRAHVLHQRVADGIIFGFALGLVRKRFVHRRWAFFLGACRTELVLFCAWPSF